MTREEALARITTLLQQNKDNLREAERLALEHNLQFSYRDEHHSATFYTDTDELKYNYGYDDEEMEEFLDDMGVQVPGWISSSALC